MEEVFHHEGILTLRDDLMGEWENLRILDAVAEMLHETYNQAQVTVVHQQVHFVGVWPTNAVEIQLLDWAQFFEDTEWLVTGAQIGYLGIRDGILVWCDVAPKQNWVNLEEVYHGETETI